MSEIIDLDMQEMAVDQALMALFENEEDTLCADCPLQGLEQDVEARNNVFQPFLPEDAKPENAPKISLTTQDVALKCLSRYRREICKMPPPEGSREVQ